MNCRICVSDNVDTEKIKIFATFGNKKVADLVLELCGLELSRNEGFPDVICQICFEQLEVAVDFKRKCLMSNRRLTELMYCQKKEIQSVDNHDKTLDNDNVETITFEAKHEEIVTSWTEEIKPEFTEVIITEEHDYFKSSENISPIFRCCGCESNFDSENRLLEHSKEIHKLQRTANTSRPFECEICYRRFKSKKGITTHRKSPYHAKPHQCTICGKLFAIRSTLEAHELSHGGQKQFQCTYCSKFYVSKGGLLEHIKQHEAAASNTKHICSICNREFARKNYLAFHFSLAHNEEKPFECAICPSKFKVKKSLRLHLRTHTGERPYQCDICDQRFMFPTDKKRHMFRHTGERPFKCVLCGKAFTRKTLLRSHHMVSHKDDPDKNVEND